jgi:acyl-CoA synthetase (AMP-forming)/AMP-acid ligase II
MELFANTIYGSFEEVTQRFPHNTAIIYLGERYSYSQLHAMVLKFAASLHK